ncbi:MAG: WXG100 family type VII secretion target [Acidimicrobiia bacterium]|nr:WXG100 family type VII secretion target [Acidimicrobiia bacterium]
MNLFGDPAAIEALANTLASRAGQVSSVGHRVMARSDACRWQCRKADRFRDEMRSRHRQSENLARELTDLSHQLRRLAAQVRAEQKFLGGLERKIRELFDAFVPGPDVTPPWEGKRWGPGNLPSPGDPAWRDVGKTLGM